MKKNSLLLIILAGVLWGTSGIFVNAWSSMGLTPLQITAIRIMLSFPCFLIYALCFNKKALSLRLRDIPFYIGSGVTLFATAACYYYSMRQTSIATAVILMYMAPVLVLGWSVAFFGEKLTAKKSISVLCMIVGCALVSGIVGGMKFNIIGIVMGLLSGVSYGIYNILTKIEMRRGCNPITATLYSFLVAAALSVIVCDFSQIQVLLISDTLKTVLLAVSHAVVTFVLPYFLYTISLKNLPAGVAAAMGVIEPMSATIFSIILFNEKLSLFSGVGIVLILGAVLVLSRTDE